MDIMKITLDLINEPPDTYDVYAHGMFAAVSLFAYWFVWFTFVMIDTDVVNMEFEQIGIVTTVFNIGWFLVQIMFVLAIAEAAQGLMYWYLQWKRDNL